MSFSMDLNRFAQKTKSNLSEASRAIKISLFTGIIRDTRVDTGRLRGNWQTTTGQPVYRETDRKDPIPQGVGGGDADREAVENVTAYGVDYMTNNLPYAETWEERDAMVAKNMARIERTVREVANDKRR